MKFLQNSSLLFVLSISLIFSIITGCGTGDDHGPTPVGLVLTIGGDEIAKQDGPTVTYSTGNHIEVTQGTTLGPILVEFIAESGERYQPDSNDGYSLQYSSTNTNVISIAQVTGANEWTIQLAGNVTGESSVTFELWHVDHSDFVSRPFQVRVVEPQLQD